MDPILADTETVPNAGELAFLLHSGEMAKRIRDHNWSQSLGAIAQWPQSLKTAVGLLVHSPIPIVLLWGEDGIMIYNDAYAQFAGRRHPELLGSKVREGWQEVADFNDNIMKVVMAGGTLTYTNHFLDLDRRGKLERVWLELGYSPVFAEDGKPGGVIAIVVETTDRVLADERRAQEQERQRRLFEQAPGFIIAMRGPQHQVEFINNQHRGLFNSGAWIGQTIRDAFPSIAGQGFFEALDRVYATGETLEYSVQEVRFRRTPDGTEETRYLTFMYAPLYDDNGAVSGVFCEGIDVTEAQRAEAALRQSEDRLRHATEAAAIGTWDYNPVTDELHWDSLCRKMFGLSADAPVTFGTTFVAGVHPGDAARVDVAARAAMAPGGSPDYDIEFRVIGIEDGVERWVAAKGSAIFNGDSAIRFVGTMLDITPRKRAERRFEIMSATGAAIAAERDVDAIVQSVTDAGVELTGADFGAFFYNQKDESGEGYMLYALSGAPREAFAKFPMVRNTEVFAPTFTGQAVVRSADILSDPRYGRNAPYNGMPQGHLPVRSYLAVPVKSHSGEVHGGLLFGHKDTGVFREEHETLLLGLAGHAATAIDNSRLISQLQHLNATLEHVVAEEVAERTRAEEQLRQAQKMEAIGQLTGGIAHDFNNMLAVVIGALSLMQRRLDRGDTNVKGYIEAATEGANRASSLTQRLLAFSRRQPLEPASLDSNKLVASMTELLGRTLGEHIQIETVLAAGLWRCFVDRVQLESAILNLAVNARDAMPEGGKLTIDTGNAAFDAKMAREYNVPEGQYVMIAVSDIGEGMNADVMKQAFEPFFTTKSVGKGSGLGLSQVFGFIRQSGGHVSLYSEVGVGTTVKLYLPRYSGPEAALPVEGPVATLSAGSGTEIVLVVEDEERVRKNSVEALKELGYSVIDAEGPRQALGLIESGQHIDLLFTDIVMPDMTGRQLAEKALQVKPGLKVLYATGYTRNAIVHNGVLDPGVSVLQKPFTVDQLAAKVRQVLDS